MKTTRKEKVVLTGDKDKKNKNLIIKKVISYLIVLGAFFSLAHSVYLDNYSEDMKQTLVVAKENYYQLGFPEGFESSDNVSFNKTRKAHNFFGSVLVEQRPTTAEEQQVLKERVEKYYAQKLAQYGWVKVPGYKNLYKKGDRQWVIIKILREGNLIVLKGQVDVYSWFETITNEAERE